MSDEPNEDDDLYSFPDIDLELPEVDLDELSDSLSSTNKPPPTRQPNFPNATAKDVAVWMEQQVQEKTLYQSSAYSQIINLFGKRFTYSNKGVPSISPEVLKEFLKLTKETVVYINRGRNKYWRKRKGTDKPGRRQRS